MAIVQSCRSSPWPIGRRMPPSQDVQRCIFCKIGGIVRSDQRIDFKQSTDKGYIFCRVAIPMDTCNHCGLKSWDHDAEAIIEEAVRQEYEKLP